MGEVFRAEHELAGRQVAIKLLRADFASDTDLTRRFFQEAQAVNKIRHPNIVDVLDAGFSEQGPYVVMECLEGATLAAALACATKLEAGAALAVVMPMLEALAAAHRHGIVHRDLKPENVFIARDRDDVRVKLMDFGIAKFLDSKETAPRTHTGVIFGTPDYLSPEQATGEGALDGRSDLFAVGIVLFELLTGKRPFEAANTVATAYKIVHAPAPSLLEMGVSADARLQGALETALEKSKDARFATAELFAAALAPLVLDPAGSSAALMRLIDAVVAHQPTQFPQGLAEYRRLGASLPQTAVEADPLARAHPGRDPVGTTLASASSPLPERLSLREMVAERTGPASSSRPLAGPISARPSSSRRVALRTRGSWTPRQLPAHVRGKCHARGTLARAVCSWIERGYGEEDRDAVLTLLPDAVAESFRTDTFNALVWYDLDAIDAFVEAASATLMGGEMKTWRELGRENFENDLGPIFRPNTRSTNNLVSPVTLLKRLPLAWGKVFDFGNVKVGDPEPATRAERERILIRIDGFDAASLALRYACIGITEGMLRGAAMSDLNVRVLSGETSFARDFEYEVTWRNRTI